MDAIKDTILEASRDRINPAIVLAIIISNINPGIADNPHMVEGTVKTVIICGYRCFATYEGHLLELRGLAPYPPVRAVRYGP